MGSSNEMEQVDLIDRQAAIDAIRGWVNKAFEDWGDATTEIRCFNAIYPLIIALPSAQPELSLEQVLEYCRSRCITVVEDEVLYKRLDSAYTEGYTASESKYRKMWDEMPKIIRCKDCRHNNDCEIQYSAQSGDEFFCGCAERKDND